MLQNVMVVTLIVNCPTRWSLLTYNKPVVIGKKKHPIVFSFLRFIHAFLRFALRRSNLYFMVIIIDPRFITLYDCFLKFLLFLTQWKGSCANKTRVSFGLLKAVLLEIWQIVCDNGMDWTEPYKTCSSFGDSAIPLIVFLGSVDFRSPRTSVIIHNFWIQWKRLKRS